MDRKELTISKDDLDEIFGGKIEQVKTKPKKEPVSARDLVVEKKNEAKKAEPPKTRPAQASMKVKKEEPLETKKPSTVIQSKISELDMPKIKPTAPKVEETDSDVDDLIKRAKEIEQEMKTTQEETKTLEFTDFLNERTVAEILEVFEELRTLMARELTGLIDTKAINNMLLRTLEKSALNFIILKNTNWSSAGKLRDNGAIDIERVLKNIDAYNSQIGELDKEIEDALHTILYMRVKSIKLGLGKDKYETVKDALMKKIRIMEAGYRKEVMNFVKQSVITPAFKRGDEEK